MPLHHLSPSSWFPFLSMFLINKHTPAVCHFHIGAWEQLHWSTFRSHNANSTKCPQKSEFSEVHHLTISEVNRWHAAHLSDWQTNTDQNSIIQVHHVNGKHCTLKVRFFSYRPTSNSQITLKASPHPPLLSVKCGTNHHIPSPYTVRKNSPHE